MKTVSRSIEVIWNFRRNKVIGTVNFRNKGSDEFFQTEKSFQFFLFFFLFSFSMRRRERNQTHKSITLVKRSRGRKLQPPKATLFNDRVKRQAIISSQMSKQPTFHRPCLSGWRNFPGFWPTAWQSRRKNLPANDIRLLWTARSLLYRQIRNRVWVTLDSLKSATRDFHLADPFSRTTFAFNTKP